MPKTVAPTLDGSSVGIKQALNVPKTDRLVNDQIRGSGKGTFDADALVIKSALTTPKPHSESDCQRNPIRMAGKFDASALHIQHGIKATKLHRSYKSDGRKIHDFLVSGDAGTFSRANHGRKRGRNAEKDRQQAKRRDGMRLGH